jgi:tetratricopeptide (TPR) repeat protein
MTVKLRAGKDIPASYDAFRGELGRQGFDHSSEVYAAMRKRSSSFSLDETTLTFWSEDLVSDGHLPEAIDLLKLNVEIHPESSEALDNLGEAYAKSGQKQLAIDSYNKSLEKSPGKDNAKQKLKELGADSTIAK